MIDIVDTHHHLWRYFATDDGWIGDDMRGLQRDYSPSELLAEMEIAGVWTSVAVQARQTLEETRWLLHLAREYPFIAGVVALSPSEQESILVGNAIQVYRLKENTP